jgi:hypothetical protein
MTKNLAPSQYKFLPDIQNIYLYKGNIWVFCATEKGKNQEVDVFNQKGKYIDHFHLKHLGKVMNIQKDHIYLKREDDESITIQKCLPVGL